MNVAGSFHDRLDSIVKTPHEFRSELAGMGSFDSVTPSLREAATALWMTEYDYRPLIDSPANAICEPQLSAKSCHRGFFHSIKTIFFARDHPFNCFSRPIAL
jgi:hypothetical protein